MICTTNETQNIQCIAPFPKSASLVAVERSSAAFHDVDEGRRIAIRQAFENGGQVSAIAKQFGVPEREVWSAVKSDGSIGGLLDERYWRHGLTVSLGNGLNVSEQQAQRRLR
jgi:hypothetical protein